MCSSDLPQSACTKEERRANIKGTIFLADDTLPNLPQHVAFIDDIYTTGSTVGECIKVLKRADKRYEHTTFHVRTVCRAM